MNRNIIKSIILAAAVLVAGGVEAEMSALNGKAEKMWGQSPQKLLWLKFALANAAAK